MKSHQELFKNYLDELIFNKSDPNMQTASEKHKPLERLLRDLDNQFGLNQLYEDILKIPQKIENELHKEKAIAIIKLGNLISQNKATKRALFEQIRNLFEQERLNGKYKNNPFPFDNNIRERFNELAEQLKEWKCESLAKFCINDYLNDNKEKINNNVGPNMLPLIPAKLANYFMAPLIEHIADLQQTFLVENDYEKYTVDSKTKIDDIKSMREKAHNIISGQEDSYEDDSDRDEDADMDLIHAQDALHLVGIEVDPQAIQTIKGNESFKKALSAAYQYFNCTKNQSFSKTYGREMTIKFIGNLWNLEDKQDNNVRIETKKFIQAKEGYHKWRWWRIFVLFIGGDSSSSKYSRASYMVKTGVFDQALIKNGIFKFPTKKNKEERKLLIQKLKSETI